MLPLCGTLGLLPHYTPFASLEAAGGEAIPLAELQEEARRVEQQSSTSRRMVCNPHKSKQSLDSPKECTPMSRGASQTTVPPCLLGELDVAHPCPTDAMALWATGNHKSSRASNQEA
jgi:hypothetical protein